MSKIHLLSELLGKLENFKTQEEKFELLSTYQKEPILKKILTIAYNPWIDFGMQDFTPKRYGKKFGMGLTKFLHLLTDIIDEKFDEKEKLFSCNMAMMHIEERDADTFLKLLKQEMDLGLEPETINRVWPGLIMIHPISNPTPGDYKTFKSYPAAVQPISRGLRVNVIIHKNKVSYKDKLGNDIKGWEIYDEQFINLAQNNSTVFDGHAIVANGTTVVETNNDKVLEADAENIRFNFWDVIRYDGFIKGEDTRIGYNWRHNGIEHMIILAIDKNKTPCYDTVKADLVGSDEQLKLTVEKYKSKCVIKSLDGTWIRGNDPSQIIYELS
jgi:hypothetical protein